MDSEVVIESYDYNLACPFAEWRTYDGGQMEFRIPRLNGCALIERRRIATADGWSYFVNCRNLHRQVHGLQQTRDEALREIKFWLRNFACPGHCPDKGREGFFPGIYAKGREECLR